VRDPAAHLRSGPLELGEIADIQLVQPLVDAPGELVVRQEMAVGRGRDRKAVRHPHPFRAQMAQHLAEGGVLASHLRDIVHPELGEFTDITHGFARL